MTLIERLHALATRIGTEIKNIPAKNSGTVVTLGTALTTFTEIKGNVGIATATPEQKLHINYGNIKFDAVPAPTAPSAVLAGLGAGSVPNGTYQYSVVYVTSNGETSNGALSSTITVTDNTTNGKINVTIPVGSTPGITYTGRKIYRASAAGYWLYYLATVNDNTTTIYTDNLAAGTGTALFPVAGTLSDTTSGSVYKGTEKAFYVGKDTSLGLEALAGLNANTFNNVAVGYQALKSLTSGRYNTVVGVESVASSTALPDGITAIGYRVFPLVNGALAQRNIGIGLSTGMIATTLSNSTFIGYNAGNSIQTGSENIIIGYSAGLSSGTLTGVTNNVMLGNYSGKAIVSNSANNIFLGHASGRYETGSNRLFIDSLDRGTEARGRTESLIYGVTSTTLANQILSLGGGGNVGIGTINPTARLHLPAGTATAGTAPFKFTSGINLTAAEAGAIEYNGTSFFATRTGTTRETIVTVVTKTTTGDGTGAEGLMQINTFDSTLKMYSEGNWRLIASW